MVMLDDDNVNIFGYFMYDSHDGDNNVNSNNNNNNTLKPRSLIHVCLAPHNAHIADNQKTTLLG